MILAQIYLEKESRIQLRSRATLERYRLETAVEKNILYCQH